MNKIISYFKQEGFDSSDLIGQKQLENLIQPVVQHHDTNFQQQIWKKQVFHKVWISSEPDCNGNVVISNYVKAVFDEHHCLNEQIHSKQSLISRTNQDLERTIHHAITSQNSIIGTKDTTLVELCQQKAKNLRYLIHQFQQDLKKLKYQQHILLHQFQRCFLKKQSLTGETQDESDINQASINNKIVNNGRKVYDRNLRILFLLSCAYICVQMLVMFCKYSFLDLLIGFLLMSIFIFSCFNHSYVKILLIFLSCSFIFDFVWLVVKTPCYWCAGKFSLNTGMQTSLQRVIILVIVIQIIIKGAISYWLWPWRKLQTQDVYYIKTIGNLDFTLIRSQAKIKLQQKLIDEVFCGVIY